LGDLSGCDGWLLVFKAELLPARAEPPTHAGAGKAADEPELARLDDLPCSHLRLATATRRAVTEALERMADDARRPASRAVNLLLRSQVQSLLMRLCLDAAASEVDHRIEPVVLRRYRRFRAAIERDFMRWHSVAAYADRLGCSEKSLTRAVLAFTDRTAKAVITDRVVLEARRELAHTLLPVAVIGGQLGFGEATNFVKFIRRETGLTPGEFRAEQRGRAPRIRST
jgi:AraC-like DNA-binding protein